MTVGRGPDTERDESAPSRTDVADSPARTDGAASPGRSAAFLLALQRTAGNNAVLRLLDRSTPRRTLQRRRVATTGELLDLVFDATGPDAAAHLAGTQRMVRRAWEELSDADKAEVRRRRLHGLTEAQFNALPAGQQSIWWAHAIRQVRPGLAGADPASVKAAWDKLSADRQAAVRRLALNGLTTAQFNALPAAEKNTRWAEAIRAVWPAFELGDPLLIDTGPRPGTADAANLQRLVDNANRVFDDVATGAQTANLRQVFGAAQVATARRKYARARQRMNLLHRRRRIVTDRSGYNVEVGLGGLTNSEQLSVSPDVIDKPDEKESVVTMIHEAMHAGNDDVDDKGYIDIDPDTFKGLAADVKLTNAAHFEVVPRRILVADFAFTGQTFTPSGSSAAAPALTPREQAIRGASELFREAWTLGLNLHMLYVGLLRTPAEWNTLELRRRFGGVAAGLKFSDTLPFWSKVMKLTIHARSSINPTAGRAATNPVTRVDVALSEGVVRKLSRCMSAVPSTEADATAFLDAKASAAERAAATTVTAERDLLIKLVLRERIGSITGSTDRDIRVVMRMGTVGGTWREILQRRAPSSFAD
jgi:DNA-binding protein YbaB